MPVSLWYGECVEQDKIKSKIGKDEMYGVY